MLCYFYVFDNDGLAACSGDYYYHYIESSVNNKYDVAMGNGHCYCNCYCHIVPASSDKDGATN